LNKSFLINGLHLLAVFLPIILSLLGMVWEESFLLSIFAILICAYISSLLLIKEKGKTSALNIAIKKRGGVKSSDFELLFFDGLWMIPRRGVIPISENFFNICVKRYGFTIKALLKCSIDINYFLIGFIAMIGVYMGLTGEFGYGVRMFSRILNASHVLQLLFLPISSWLSLLYLFNGFFRFTLSRRNK